MEKSLYNRSVFTFLFQSLCDGFLGDKFHKQLHCLGFRRFGAGGLLGMFLCIPGGCLNTLASDSLFESYCSLSGKVMWTMLL